MPSPSPRPGVHPIVLVLAAAASIQLGAAIAVTLFDDIGAAGAAFLRLGLAALIMIALRRPRLRGRPAAEWRLASLLGLALGAMNICFYEATARLPLGPTVALELLGPVCLAAVLARRARDLAWVGLALAGVLLLTAPWSAQGLAAGGVAFALGAAACWALYILLAERTGRVFPGMEGLAIAMAVGTLVPLVPGLVAGGTDLVRPDVLGVALVVAMLSSVVPYTLEMETLRRIPARVFGVLMSLEPAVAALMGLLVLGQRLVAREVVAMALVVVASAGILRTAPAPPAPAAIEA